MVLSGGLCEKPSPKAEKYNYYNYLRSQGVKGRDPLENTKPLSIPKAEKYYYNYNYYLSGPSGGGNVPWESPCEKPLLLLLLRFIGGF